MKRQIENYLMKSCEGKVDLYWKGNDLLVIGPKGEQLYRQIEPWSASKYIQQDEFYVDDFRPEYDLIILADRIIGDVVKPVPQAILSGHAVKVDLLDSKNSWYEWVELKDRIAIVSGDCTEQNRFLNMVFSSSGHRGYGVRYKFSRPATASISGGPCPTGVPTSEFYFSGEYQRVDFWRWRDGACGDGGEYYSLNVPLWYWRSESLRNAS